MVFSKIYFHSGECFCESKRKLSSEYQASIHTTKKHAHQLSIVIYNSVSVYNTQC